MPWSIGCWPWASTHWHAASCRSTTRYRDLDLPFFGSSYGLAWVIGEADYDTLRDLGRTRIRAELPAAIQLDIWKDFRHSGDGIHPDDATTAKAAKIIALELKRRD
jgi:hypothetical protein